MKKTILLLFALCAAAGAHFQVIYTPQVQSSDKSVTVLLFFTHPFTISPLLKTGLQENGTVLGMKDVFIVHDGKVKDMMWATKDVPLPTPTDTGPAQKLYIDQSAGYKSAGDYAIIAVPYPYWEASEKTSIQQIAKLFINKAGFASDWNRRCAKGYPEIVPLVKPYEMVPGSLFRAVVLDNAGKAAPGVSVEVEFLNADVDMASNRLVNCGKVRNEKLGAATVLTDANGVFEYIPLKAGFWGFAGISAGSEKMYKGKALEQDPVIWIQVTDADADAK
jgi:cobalt/nickel transport protein